MKKIFCAVLCIVLLWSLCGCGKAKESQLNIFAMDTYMSLVAYGSSAESALEAASHEINSLESTLSRTKDGSDVARLNETGSCEVDTQTSELIREAISYNTETQGAFDITVAPIVLAWGINTESPRVPSQEELDTLLTYVGSEHIHIDGQTVSLDEGCAIDLGGIAKGYASDKVAQVFQDYGVESAIVSLGGNVYARGTKPDGSLWSVAIQDPQSDNYAALLNLKDTYAVTSGGYQRYFTDENGTVYQHILDPKTGMPVQGDLLSVTIVAENGTMADAYSTALYVMGEEEAIRFYTEHASSFDMILITTDNRLLYTEGLKDALNEVKGSGYTYELIQT